LPDTAIVTLRLGDEATHAFVAWREAAPALGIDVAHSVGASREIRDEARQASREGYVVIVPDL
jgi:dienelactone hydrolase